MKAEAGMRQDSSAIRLVIADVDGTLVTPEKVQQYRDFYPRGCR